MPITTDLSYVNLGRLVLACKYLTDFSCNSARLYPHDSQCSSVSVIMSWNNTCKASPLSPPKFNSCGTICGKPLISCIAPLTRAYWSLCASFHEKLPVTLDRKSTRLNSSHVSISYAVFC